MQENFQPDQQMKRHESRIVALCVGILGLLGMTGMTACDPGPAPRTTPEGLLHHYPFDGHGRIVFDTVGWADGMVMGRGQLDGSGSVSLDGSDDYVDLPNGIISKLDSLTLELVIQTKHLEGRYPRIFSFGNSTIGEVEDPGARDGEGNTFLELTLQAKYDNVQQLGFSYDRGGEFTFNCSGERSLVAGRIHHLLVVVDDKTDRIAYFLDGEENCVIENVVQPLSTIKDVNNWLGRSQWTNDDMPKITFFDLKIYERAMPAEEVRRLYDSGAWRPVQEPGE